MGLIKDIKDIESIIDTSNIKGSLKEWDIVITNEKDGPSPHVVIYDLDFLKELRSYFDGNFIQEHGLPILIGYDGYIDMNNYKDDLTHSTSIFTITKIYRPVHILNNQIKSKFLNLMGFDHHMILHNLINSNQYELIWERTK